MNKFITGTVLFLIALGINVQYHFAPNELLAAIWAIFTIPSPKPIFDRIWRKANDIS